MRPTNFPSASRPAACTRGTSFWSVTVSVGDWAAAGEAAAAPSRARNAGPALTSEAVVESQRESQRFAGRHRLRDVQAEPAPIDAQPDVREPAAERRQPVGGEAAGPVAHQPCLSRVSKDHEIGSLEREQGLR